MRYNEDIITKDCLILLNQFEHDLKKIKNKVIITGGAGFLLSYFCNLIFLFNKENSKKIILEIYDNFTFGFPERLKKFKNDKYIKFIKSDIIKKKKFDKKCEIFIHGASIASPTYYRKFPIETIKANVIGLLNILENYKRNKFLKSFIFMSSSEVYGDPPNNKIPTDEKYNGNVSFIGPRACYDESKRIGETICINYFDKFNVPVKIIRPFNVYGPGQNVNDKRIVPDILKSLLAKKNLVMFSDGKPTRSFCYISDQISGILEVIFNGQKREAYNVGNDHVLSIKKFATLFIKISKVKINIIFKKSQDNKYTKDNPQKRCPNINKLKKISKWRPKVNIKDGIKKTLEYYNIN